MISKEGWDFMLGQHYRVIVSWRRLLTTSVLVVLITAGTVPAQSVSNWIDAAGGNYGTAGNWSNGVANSVGSTADFGTLDIFGDVFVDINSNVMLGHLVFGDTGLSSAGTWAISDSDSTPAILTFDAAEKPTITAGELTPTAGFDDSYLGVVLAGINGFRKLGTGVLTSAGYNDAATGTLINLNHTITGSIDIEEGTLRFGAGTVLDLDTAATPEVVSFNLSDGTTLETAVPLRNVNVASGATANVQWNTTEGGNQLGNITGHGTGETLNLNISGTARVDLVLDNSGFDIFNVVAPNAGDQRDIQLAVDFGDNSANQNLWQNSVLHLDNVLLFIRTNSFGNTIPIAELTGTSTASLSGGNAGSAARYEIGSNNNDSEFAGVIDGSGGISINKVGTGTLTLSGSAVDTPTIGGTDIGRTGGVVRVSAGTLALTNTFDTFVGGDGTDLTTVDVLAGAILDVSGTTSTYSSAALQQLQGSGTIVGTYNHDEGMIRPADVSEPGDANETDLTNSAVPTFGTITFDGDLQLNGGDIIYDLALDPGMSDLVHVTGSTAINGGRVVPSFPEGVPTSGTYTVVTSDGGFTGNVTNLQIDFPGRSTDPIPSIQGNAVVFEPTELVGSASLTWQGNDGTNPSFWDIEVTPNWDNSGSPDVFFELDTVTFDDTASSFAVNVTEGVSPSSVTIDNTANAYTFTGDGSIGGSGGLTKNGSGMLTMQVGNNFVGDANINGGTVDIGTFGNALGQGSLNLNGATIIADGAGGLNNSGISVADGTVNTLQANGGDAGAGGAFGTPNLSGSGTITLTSTLDDKFFALNGTADFTGTFNMEPGPGNATIGARTVGNSVTTFPSAVVNLTGATLANGQDASTDAVFSLGELHGDANSNLNGFIGDSTAPAITIWEVGGLNTDSDFAGVISDGTGGGGSVTISHVRKIGAGTLELTGTNTYTGDTTVEAGRLSINSSFLSDMGNVFLTTGGILDLDFAGTDTINALFFDGNSQAVGTWGGAGSGAANFSSFFSGTGVLDVTTFIEAVTGDYNNDGVVNAADYVVWRNNLGTDNLLPGDLIGGTIGQAQYAQWKNNYGNTAPMGSGNSAVPEPTSAVSLALAAMVMLVARRKH